MDGFNESDLKVTHFRDFAIDHDRAEEKTPQELQEWAVQGLLAVVGDGPKSAALSRNRPIGASEALKRGGLLQSDIDYNSVALRPLAFGINIGQDGVFAQVRLFIRVTSERYSPSSDPIPAILSLSYSPLPTPDIIPGWHGGRGLPGPSSAALAPQHAVQSTAAAELVFPQDG